jgi:hypothetical protein
VVPIIQHPASAVSNGVLLQGKILPRFVFVWDQARSGYS